ncbi:MAG TPA: carboxypeptidase-like regulatory domain-containing protein, partial [Candidatus Angelobacter sp.]|nr:carboxypeptidase-like regulatory domain-containing protein [Candidatus Angelobacter sp.]
MAIGHKIIFLTALALFPGTASRAAEFQAEDPERAIVEGTVINAQNSRTIPRASVMLQGMKGAGSKSARADGNGHFIFQHVEPGLYKLMAERQGFFSDERKRESQPMLEVAAGQHLKNMPVRLMPTAAVSGEIVDEYNDYLQNVEVTLLATEVRLGRMYLRPAGKTTTDDRGQYRLAGLRPGRYYLVAEYQSKTIKDNILANFTAGVAEQTNFTKRGEPIKIEVVPATPDPPFTYPPLFYPATGDFKQAQALRLNSGDETSANFIFISAPVVAISGRVTNGMTGGPAGTASVSAYWTEYMQGEGLPARVSPADGTFEIRGVAPGSYTLRASFTEDGQTYAGEQTVEVG